MTHARRGLKGGVVATTVVGSLGAADVIIPGAELATWSGTTTNGAATGHINRLFDDAEEITYTGIAGGSLTGVTRGTGGTTAQSHADGATLEHGVGFTDFDEANELVAAVTTHTVRVYNDAAISIPDDTLTDLTFNTERWDLGTAHSTSAETNKLVCKKAGTYLIFGSCGWATNATGIRSAAIALNGAVTYLAVDRRLGSATVTVVTSVSTVYQLALNDYVTLVAYQNSTGALNVNASTKHSPEFGMHYLGF